jgi:hypothetical protein
MRNNNAKIGQAVLMERLEGRQFMSVSVPGQASLSHALAPAVTVKAAILRPSQVEGSYRGKVTVSAGGLSESVKFEYTVTSDSVTIGVIGYGSYTFPISSSQLHKLRDGSFNETRTVDGETGHVAWTVSDSGKKCVGSFSVAGVISFVGSFSVAKIS